MIKFRKKTKILAKKSVFYVLLIIFLGGMLISSYHIIHYLLDQSKTNNQIESINNLVEIHNVPDSEVEVIKQESEISESNPYWYYMKTKLIDVNFNDLKSINKDVKGWIQVTGTNINYPFVQGDDNAYYLNHSFDKSYNSAGWIFLDYRNNLSKDNDKNTIIYAHGMKNKTMFGTLRNILNNDWLNDKNNYIIKLSTEYENTLWQVFSVYHIPTTNDYIKITFNNDSEFEDFANKLINRSTHNFNTSVSGNDRILTLSTCYDKNDKVVLHAKLIKREQK